jgi:bifunctional UDP-N-acetylglucosamine pyrophosphorylase/glucosamine-1-phosphate N-acetyltransferase
MSLTIIILAAGQGTRMYSQIPKVLHRLAGKPLLTHVVQSTLELGATIPPIVVYGHQGEVVRKTLAHLNVTWVEQPQQLGTGHALLQVLPHLSIENRVLVLYGDGPLITSDTLQKFVKNTPADAIGIITARIPDPTGLGRIIRDSDSKIIKIVEEKEANSTEKAINEINSGIYLFPARYLHAWLPHLKNHNSQKEFYITDLVALATQNKISIHGQEPAHYEEVLGINNRIQLAEAERFYQRRYAEQLMRQGVTLCDPHRFDVRGELTVGSDVIIDINVIIEGRVVIGNHCIIGPNTLLRDVTLSDHVEVKANCVIDNASIAEHSVIGPFARIRPGTRVSSHVKIGNFIEIKNSLIGSHTKIHHVGYIGDSELGKHVNIGAGTITCNYDGANKYKTIINDDAFIGSNTALVSPVTIGTGATIGAGSTITRDAPSQQLTICRGQQRSIPHWQRKKKLPKEEI